MYVSVKIVRMIAWPYNVYVPELFLVKGLNFRLMFPFELWINLLKFWSLSTKKAQDERIIEEIAYFLLSPLCCSNQMSTATSTLVDKEYKNEQGIRKFLQDPFRWNSFYVHEPCLSICCGLSKLLCFGNRICTESAIFCIPAQLGISKDKICGHCPCFNKSNISQLEATFDFISCCPVLRQTTASQWSNRSFLVWSLGCFFSGTRTMKVNKEETKHSVIINKQSLMDSDD